MVIFTCAVHLHAVNAQQQDFCQGVVHNGICACRYTNGKYPYPFMNKMHPAAAFLTMLCVSLAVLHLMSTAGATLAAAASKALSKPDIYVATAPMTNGKAKPKRAVTPKPARTGGPVLRSQARNVKNGNKQH